MTIRFSRQEKHFVAQCDKCSCVVDFEDLGENSLEHFLEAKERIDADKWQTRRDSNSWGNICPDCV